MELIMVNALKLKIILTPADMEKLNITNDTLDYDTTATKRAFWELLDKAKRETGFDASNDKLYVQVFPANDGGCEMFVTKQLPLGNDLNIAGQAQVLHRKRCKPDNAQQTEIICETGDLESVILLCIRLHRSGFRGTSKLYLVDKKTYALVLNTRRSYPSFTQGGTAGSVINFPFLGEYAAVISSDKKKLSYLDERAELICAKDAVKTFSYAFQK